jgi:hypothetical protein
VTSAPSGTCLERSAWLRRTESDLLVKMNTGGGKTVVGLMTISRGHAAYDELANLFDDALRDQSPSAVRAAHPGEATVSYAPHPEVVRAALTRLDAVQTP